MFRIGIKFTSNPQVQIYKIKKYGYSNLHTITRNNQLSSVVISTNRANKDARILLQHEYSRAKYSSEPPPSGKKGKKGILFLGTFALGTIGVLTIAKNNPDIRKMLDEWIPGTDNTLKVIFQEEESFIDNITNYFGNLKQSITGSIFGDDEQSIKKSIDKPEQKAPKPTFEPLVTKKEPPVNDSFNEIRHAKDKNDEIKTVVEKPTPQKKEVPEELKPTNLVELENLSGQAAAKAITAYQDAAKAIQDFNKDVVQVIESVGVSSNVSAPVWQRLKEATEKRKKAVRKAEENATDALKSLKKLSNLVDDSKFDAPAVMKSVSRRNIKKIIDDVDAAKKNYEDEERSANITERYWTKVQAARENFNEELQILFPNINIHDKTFSVNEESFDLFVLYMYNKLNYIQKELEKTETIDNAKLRSALKATGDLASEEKINELVCREVNREKRLIIEESEKKLLAERKLFDEELRRQIKLQSQVHADHLKEILESKEKEMERIINRAIDEKTEAESNKYKIQLAAIVGRLRGLDEALKLRLSEEKGACDAQLLWAACQALSRAVQVGPPGAPTDKPVRPLEAEIKAISKVAPKDDALVQATLSGIPKEAITRGVFPEDALRERFLKVEHVARRLALVPEEGASLPIYILSYIQSFLLLKAKTPIPKSELSDEPIDPSLLDTHDVLNRARYWLDRGDFKMTLRYMNLLKGASRSVATDWMNETRILLETKQAVDTLIAYAGAIGLVFLGSGDKKN